jgi:SsrA-binding protein
LGSGREIPTGDHRAGAREQIVSEDAKAAGKRGEKVITTNRKAHHDYFILDSIEAGIELRGTEVKSLRAGGVNLKDSYVDTRNGQMTLIGVHISPYETGNRFNHEPERPRRLLLHKREILRWSLRAREKSLTIVPLRMYFKNGRAKVEIALVKGKRSYDKREAIADRESRRELDRALKEARDG